ncbi:MAG TPA: ABC transporter substrate-binding protein [Baekduia sp.]
MVACGSSDKSSDTATSAAGATKDANAPITVKVGLAGPKTGPVPAYWKELSQSFALGEQDFGKEFNIKFDVVDADTQASPEIASQQVQKLLNQDNVDVLFGPALSGEDLQVADIVQRSGRPWMVPIAADDAILNMKIQPNWGFRTNNSNNQALAVTGASLYADNATVGIVYSADAYGQSSLKALQDYAKKNGKTVAASEAITPGATDMTAAVKKLQSANVNSVYIAVTAGADIATLTRSMVREKYDPPKQFATATILTDFRELASPKEWAKIRFVEPRDLTGPTITKLIADYKKLNGSDPVLTATSFAVYTSVKLYAQAVRAAGTATDYEKVRKAIEDTKTLDVDGMVFDHPYSPTDHETYDSDPAKWYLLGFDEKGNIKSFGKVTGS